MEEWNAAGLTVQELVAPTRIYNPSIKLQSGTVGTKKKKIQASDISSSHDQVQSKKNEDRSAVTLFMKRKVEERKRLQKQALEKERELKAEKKKVSPIT